MFPCLIEVFAAYSISPKCVGFWIQLVTEPVVSLLEIYHFYVHKEPSMHCECSVCLQARWNVVQLLPVICDIIRSYIDCSQLASTVCLRLKKSYDRSWCRLNTLWRCCHDRPPQLSWVMSPPLLPPVYATNSVNDTTRVVCLL